ncbi:MAG: GerAB/ArcD/ProY family transporter [Lachnospiraceae bacterium]|nr:GerAB/ArcD/ProY family transporter [Lachnospiraceae bacterium]
MFNNNGYISEKQLRRMVVLPVFVSVILVVPYVSAVLFGENVLLGLFTFFALSGLYVLVISAMSNWYQKINTQGEPNGFISALTETGLPGKALTLLTVARLILHLAFYILLTISVLEEAQVPFMIKTTNESNTNLLVATPLLLVALYGANRKMEHHARMQEMIFWVIFIPFILMIVFGLKEVDYQIFVPQSNQSFGDMLLYAYMLLFFVTPMEYYLFLRPSLRAPKDKVKQGVIGAIFIGLVLTLFLLGIYGVNGAASEPMVTTAIMRYIRLPFGVLERFDVLVIWFFVTGCFVLICETLYITGHIFHRIWKREKIVWLLVATLFLAALVVLFLRSYEESLLTFICYGALLDIPLSLLVPLLGGGLYSLYRE